jgi:hypothetical protein
MLFASAVFSQAYYRNPFESLLPKEEKPAEPAKKKKAPETLPVTVEGVLWDSSTPQTIIDGDVYKVGDTLKKIDAKVFRIDKNIVYLTKEDKVYKKTVGKEKKGGIR